MEFSLKAVPGGPESLPLLSTDVVEVAAPAAAVFAVLAEIGTWNRWFSGMRRVRIDGTDSGVGALRTVWVGATRVQERFDVWEEGRRLGLSMTSANLPGLRSMAEEWEVARTGDGTSRLTIKVGVEPRLLLKPLGPLVTLGVHQATRGGANITSMFKGS
jgi:hypothetical protein